MSLTPEQIALKAAALAATPGPWRMIKQRLRPGMGPIIHELVTGAGGAIVKWPGFDGLKLNNSEVTANVRYMAAANPAAILTLLAQLEAQEAPTATENLQDEEILSLHRQLAAEKLRADQGWERYESANRSRQITEYRLAAAQPVQAAPDLQTIHVLESALILCNNDGQRSHFKEEIARLRGQSAGSTQ